MRHLPPTTCPGTTSAWSVLSGVAMGPVSVSPTGFLGDRNAESPKRVKSLAICSRREGKPGPSRDGLRGGRLGLVGSLGEAALRARGRLGVHDPFGGGAVDGLDGCCESGSGVGRLAAGRDDRGAGLLEEGADSSL